MRSLILTILGLAGLIAGQSCISDDISVSPTDILTFSADTVTFDTVFTDLGTPTARLLVFNRSKKGIKISQIRFKREDTNFQLNVDGASGKSFHDVEIRGNDSIYVFIECFIPESASNEPYLVEDQLIFQTNGVQQEVQVEAYGQNVTRLRNVRLTTDTRLTAERPYVVFDSLTIDPGVKLTIDPGARILFHDKASLVLRGSLEAVGTKDAMIDLRGDRLDNVLPEVSYDIMSGQWGGIRIRPESFDNRLEFVNMRSTYYGVDIDSCGNTASSKLLIVNSWLHNSQGSVLTSRHARVDAYGSCFSEAADAVVALHGGEHNFVQCTLANYYLFAVVSQPILSLYHLFPDDMLVSALPLMKARFDNCIIYGLGESINKGDLTDTDVFLSNVLLGSDGSDDANFIACLWNEDPLFLTRREKYYFNYHLEEGTPAAGKGNPSFVTDLCRYDMDGVDRLANGAPTLGAYARLFPKPEN